MSSKITLSTLILFLIMVFLLVIPFFFAPHDADFEGADGKAEKTIEEIHPDYQPWFTPILEPPSEEIASLLFSLQAAIGSGIIFYYLGYKKGKKASSSS